MQKDFEILPHTADLKIRAYGKDLKTLFSHMIKGMFSSIHPVTNECTYEQERLVCEKLSVSRPIDVKSHDLESLLVDFLSEALSLSDIYHEAYLDIEYSDMNVESDGDTYYIKGTLKGIKIEDFEGGEIKAVTHHDVKVEKKGDVWVAEVLFDL